MENTEKTSLNFIEQLINEDLKNGRFSYVHTRFPPEPNGRLHIGHASAICTNFGIAAKYGGKTNLRFDDTNPVNEDISFVHAIKEDIKWLGFDWEEREYFASNYFDRLYEMAVQLIQQGDAYVEDASADEIAAMKGTTTEPGTNSPSRSRSPEENLDLFERMKAGEFDEGSKTIRVKIDMSHPNMLMRDPIIYRIKKAHHHQTGDKWCIYPMYDFAHGLSDSIEGISFSLCSLEFEEHRPLYDWLLVKLGIFHSRQIEFARLNLNYTIMSKRKLRKLVEDKIVNDWDDPRMPTISGMRRRGYTPAAIRNFIDKVGISKRNKIIDLSLLEFCVREDLNKKTNRLMAVLNPIKVTITNYPEGQSEEMEMVNNPEDETAGSRKVPFSGSIYIEQDDFMENPPRKFFRLGVGKHVRLKGAYIIHCDEAVKDAEGNITELLCSYVPESRSGNDTSGLKVKGTIHWVSAEHAKKAEVRLYDRLFSDENPDGHKEKDFMEFINENSLELITAFIEPALAEVPAGEQVQFLRKGYFCADLDTTELRPVFNRTVTLRDSWAKKK